MKTFEGTFHVKFHKNLYGKKLPVTFDCETKDELVKEQKRIRREYIEKDKAISVVFDMCERK
ncbi:MAG: hypothetical protein KAT14_07845 [Candidatus Marinimicrobia bacterium]|nr:hypothetical protein [Candidatus Neomarinimicrobiota bacterium]